MRACVSPVEATVSENGRVGVKWGTYSQEFYCGTCFGYIGPTGKRLRYDRKADDDLVIVWVECSSCLGRRLAREAEEEAARLREQEKRRPRECELDGCDEMFVPATRWQSYCCDEHRWRAHRERKRSVRVNGSA
jgi:hypothetical protein